MDPDRARQLLARERTRIEESLAAIERDGPLEGDDRKEPGDMASGDLYQDEFNAGRLEDLHQQLDALKRAEGRLEDGTYGLSVDSGEPIPDGLLEALPLTERTADEERARRR